MIKKVTFGLLLLLVLAGMLTGCGISKEKSQAIESAKESLHNARYKAETNYGTLTDDAFGGQITELGEKADQIDQTGIHKMDEQEAEGFLNTITELTTKYGVLQASIDEEAQKEKQVKKQREETLEVPVYICNGTGRTLTMIKMTDMSSRTDNILLSDGQILGINQILLGGVVNVRKDSTEWQITAVDDTNQTLVFENVDLSGAKTEGISLTLECTENGNTANMGSYVSEKATDQSTVSESCESTAENSN